MVIQSFDLNQNVKNVHDKTYKFCRIHYKYLRKFMLTVIINEQNQNMFAVINHQCAIQIKFHDYS